MLEDQRYKRLKWAKGLLGRQEPRLIEGMNNKLSSNFGEA